MHVDPRLFSSDAIDASTRAANEMIEKLIAQQPSMLTQTPAQIRAARDAGAGTLPVPVKLAHAEMRAIRGPAGEIPLRVFRHEQPRGVYLHIHGGGWTLGAADQQDVMLDAISRAARVTVVSVEYRLAPEHPYPAGPDDCEAAALWVARNAERELGAARLAIGGESAGAHLSAVTLLRLRDRHGLTPFAAANLVYGCYDLGFTPSVRNWGERNLVLSTPIIEWFTNHFAPDRARRASPDASPLLADLRGMPPALFTVGTLDPLLDDSLFMAQRWLAAGNRAELAIYPGGVHGFNLFPMPLGEAALRRSESFLADAFSGETK
jgi:acetyl esterase/lipase